MRYNALETFHGIPCLFLSPLAFYYFVVFYAYLGYMCVWETRFRSVLTLVLYLYFLRHGHVCVSLVIGLLVGRVRLQTQSLPGTLVHIWNETTVRWNGVIKTIQTNHGMLFFSRIVCQKVLLKLFFFRVSNSNYTGVVDE